MSLKQVESGRQVPNDVNVVIEISSRSDPIKYEVDKDTGVLMVDRFVATCIIPVIMAMCRKRYQKTVIRLMR